MAPLPEGLFLAANILVLGMIIPFLNFLVAFVLIGIHLVVVAKICDGVNAIAGKVAAIPAPVAG